MKGYCSDRNPLSYIPGWVVGWMDGEVDDWMDVKAVLSIAYGKKISTLFIKQPRRWHLRVMFENKFSGDYT
jgi:hypothetical protein